MIKIDLGNLWDMLSAIGTIGAVVVSLWLSFRKTNSKSVTISSLHILSQAEHYTFSIHNGNNKIIKITKCFITLYKRDCFKIKKLL